MVAGKDLLQLYTSKKINNNLFEYLAYLILHILYQFSFWVTSYMLRSTALKESNFTLCAIDSNID